MSVLRSPVMRHLVRHVLGRVLGSVREARLGGFAGRHDGGKAASPWVGKVFFASGEWADHEGLVAHLLRCTILQGQSEGPLRAAADAIGWRDLYEWCGGNGRLTMQYVLAAAMHHGGPRAVSAAVDPTSWDPRDFVGYHHKPIGALASLAATIDGLAVEANQPDAEPLPDIPALVHLFHGLVTAADWIASTERLFPYAASPGEDRAPRLSEMVTRARFSTGFTLAPRLESDVAKEWFRAVCAGRPPRPVQTAIGALPMTVGELCARLLVLEARTASGKTEAALIWFARLLALGLVNGIVFALPTRSSAAQIFRRIRKIVGELLPDLDPLVHVVCAVPGYSIEGMPDATAADDQARDATMGEGMGQADAGRVRTPGVSWAAESSKRFLAAPIVVGTIDQVLLSGLRVKHAHMRAAFLLGKLLVIDEAHSFDAYMAMLLGNVVQRQIRMGGYAMLMSATLGDSALRAIVGDAAGPPGADATRIAYPLLRSYDAVMEPGEPGRRVQSGPPRLKFLNVGPASGVSWPTLGEAARPSPLIRVTEYARALDEVAACVQAGGRVLIVRSTVRKARATLRHLRARGVPVMAIRHQVDGRPVETLHHSRFAQEDRRLLDREIEEALNPGRALSTGLAVVATQTCEQSLDIDADLLVSDPCPADILIQRLGRLFRKLETARTPGWETPRALLLDPGDWDEYLAPLGKDGFQFVETETHSFAQVYRNLVAVRRTLEWFAVPGGRSFDAMTDARPMVERCTDWTSLLREYQDNRGRKAELWKRLGGDLFIAKADHARGAEAACFHWDVPFGDEHVSDITGEATTRLDINEVTAVFPAGTIGPFGAEVRRVSIPRRWLGKNEVVADPWQVARISPIPDGGFSFHVGETRFVYDATGVRKGDDGT